MYYAESFHDGKAWFRTSPDGPWIEIPAEEVWRRCQEAEKRAQANFQRIPDSDDLRAVCSMADAHIDHLMRLRKHPDEYAQASRMQVVGDGHNTVNRVRATLPQSEGGA
jgi:hypothetical protein